MTETVAILGAGAWGTALAIHLARTPAPPAIVLWARDARQAQAMQEAGENARYLPGVALPRQIAIAIDPVAAVAAAALVIVAPPIGGLLDGVTATPHSTRA